MAINADKQQRRAQLDPASAKPVKRSNTTFNGSPPTGADYLTSAQDLLKPAGDPEAQQGRPALNPSNFFDMPNQPSGPENEDASLGVDGAYQNLYGDGVNRASGNVGVAPNTRLSAFVGGGRGQNPEQNVGVDPQTYQQFDEIYFSQAAQTFNGPNNDVAAISPMGIDSGGLAAGAIPGDQETVSMQQLGFNASQYAQEGGAGAGALDMKQPKTSGGLNLGSGSRNA